MSDGDYLRMLADHARIVELQAENIALKKKCARLEGRLDAARAVLGITTNQGEKQEEEPQTAAQNMKPAT